MAILQGVGDKISRLSAIPLLSVMGCQVDREDRRGGSVLFFVAMQPPASPQRLLRLPEAALQLSVLLRTIHVAISSLKF